MTDFNQKFEAFKDAFDAAINSIVEKVAEHVGVQPTKTSPNGAAHMLKGKKKIMILTGYGFSPASGISTFTCEEGLFKKKYAGIQSPAVFLNKSFFSQNPAAVWEWYYDFLELQMSSQPNNGHKAIQEF